MKEGERKEDLGLREQREKGDLGGKKVGFGGQKRGNERHGAFPHQMRSDGSN